MSLVTSAMCFCTECHIWQCVWWLGVYGTTCFIT